MARTVRLDLDQEHLTVAPGETARLLLTLRNTSDVVEHLQIEVRGLPPGARAVTDPPTVKLLPGATAQCTTTLELPADPAADAGPHVLGVLARSPHRREVSRCEEVRLDVPAQPALSLAVEPELVRTGGRAAFTLTLVDEGNTPLQVALAGSDPERSVQFRFSPPEVPLRPRRAAQVTVTVHADRPWTGQEVRRPLTLTASDGGTSAVQTVTLVQPPRLPPVVLRSLAGVVGLLVLAGTILVAQQLTDDGDAAAGGDGPVAPSSSAEASAQPSDSAPPSPTPSSTAPGGGASNEPSESPSASPSPSDGPTVLPSPLRTVEMTDDQDGGAVRAAGTRVTRLGFEVVVAPVAAGRPTGCDAVEQLAVHEDVEGDYVTASVDVADPSRCDDVPLTVRFLDPVTDVVLEVAEDGDYRLAAVTASGAVEEPVTRRALDGLVTAVEGQRIRELTLSGAPEGDAPEQVGLVRVQYRPAGPG